jgi:tetratricopeptide (TPR) repeat protein
MRKALGVFAVVFVLYLRALPPALAPWRDTGEMSLAGWTLGVAHPTSYPFYVLLARAAACVPLGNYAYRLNVLSAAAGAAAAAVLFAFARRRAGFAAALFAAATLALNPTMWTVSSVSEMYSLWVLEAMLIMILAGDAAEKPFRWTALCFLAGLSLANRLDLLLWGPGLIWLATSRRSTSKTEDGLWLGLTFALIPALAAATGSNVPFALLLAATLLWRSRGTTASAALAGIAGLSIYLYLPLRSAGGPLLDWNHPATPSHFLDSILRTRYGGTLDLISKSYALGANFDANVGLWAHHLWTAFGPAGLLAGAAGCAVEYRADRPRWLGRAACWWWSGPVFLFLANMPPNPHAAAIVEPHYLLSDAVLLFWCIEGAAALAASGRLWPAALAVAALVWPLWRGVPQAQDRREHFYSYDFARNVLRATPPGGVVVLKKDVPLYALWHYQHVAGLRPDVRVVAQGLAASPWYIDGWRRRDSSLVVGSLAGADGWLALAAGGRIVLASPDAELPPGIAVRSRGLLTEIAHGEAATSGGDWELMVRRGPHHYGETPDFFTSDLIDEAAAASYRRGLELQKAGREGKARVRLLDAWRMNWNMPEASQFLSYMDALAGRWSDALSYATASENAYRRKLAMAEEFRALPDVQAAVRRAAAETVTQRGVALEKSGRRDDAAAAYFRALALFPLAQTHYDLAVLYWGKDAASAQRELTETLRLDPGHAEARRFLGLIDAAKR